MGKRLKTTNHIHRSLSKLHWALFLLPQYAHDTGFKEACTITGTMLGQVVSSGPQELRVERHLKSKKQVFIMNNTVLRNSKVLLWLDKPTLSSQAYPMLVTGIWWCRPRICLIKLIIPMCSWTNIFEWIYRILLIFDSRPTTTEKRYETGSASFLRWVFLFFF